LLGARASEHDAMRTFEGRRAPWERVAARRATRVTLLLPVPLLFIPSGVYGYAWGGHEVEAKDAYVKADILPVSAEVPGKVIEVVVQESERVATGAPLFRIDPMPFEIDLAGERG